MCCIIFLLYKFPNNFAITNLLLCINGFIWNVDYFLKCQTKLECKRIQFWGLLSIMYILILLFYIKRVIDRFFFWKSSQGRLFQYRTTLGKTMVSLLTYHREENVAILLILSTIPDLTKIDFMSSCN